MSTRENIRLIARAPLIPRHCFYTRYGVGLIRLGEGLNCSIAFNEVWMSYKVVSSA